MGEEDDDDDLCVCVMGDDGKMRQFRLYSRINAQQNNALSFCVFLQQQHTATYYRITWAQHNNLTNIHTLHWSYKETIGRKEERKS